MYLLKRKINSFLAGLKLMTMKYFLCVEVAIFNVGLWHIYDAMDILVLEFSFLKVEGVVQQEKDYTHSNHIKQKEYFM